MSFQCNKDYAAPRPTYEFTEKLTLTPYKKTYAINDTIWLQFQTNNKALFDRLTNSRIATDTIYLSVNLNLYRRYPNGQAELFSEAKVENAIDVNFAPLYSHYNVLSFKTDCGSNRYFFRAAFVPKKTGIYSIDPRLSLVPCPGMVVFPYSSSKFTFDLADCNKDVWLSIPPASRGGEMGHTDVVIDKKEIFVFKVE